jgi:hypothetical protein
MIAEPDDTTYDDEMLGAIIDSYAEATLPLASSASNVWLQKAATYAELVNISEGGSSRSMGDLHKRALEMAKIYQVQVDGAVDAGRSTRIARLVR